MAHRMDIESHQAGCKHLASLSSVLFQTKRPNRANSGAGLVRNVRRALRGLMTRSSAFVDAGVKYEKEAAAQVPFTAGTSI